MKWKRFLSGVMALVMVLSMCVQAVPAARAEGTVYTVEAPTADLKIEFWLDESGAPWYQVVRKGAELIEDSPLGLNTSLGALNTGLTLAGEPVADSGDSTWEPVVGEQAEIRDCWNELSLTLTQESSGVTFGIALRAYDEGVTLRYILPESDAAYTVSDEYTQFRFQAGGEASLHVGGNQTVPNKYKVESLPSSTVQRPATVEFADGQCLTICEANLENFAVMTMTKGSSARSLECNLFSTVTVSSGDPAASPWRVLVMGDEPTDLLENDTIVQNLNEPADEETYGFSQWLDPGTCVRATTGLNNTAIKGVIDLAAEHGIRYVLLDSGWYGPEYDANADPRLDPSVLDPENAQDAILLEKYFATEGGYNNTGEGVFNTNGNGFNQYGKLGDGGTMQVNVDIPALCEYANARGVGIVLYVNKVFLPDSSGRNRFTVDELFGYFEKWGVAGVKPGFVNVRSQKNEAYMEEVIEAAAKHKLVMTVHDEYVTTGQERTFPNLMMTEGILGDEGIGKKTPQAAEDIATIFTRNVQGPPDHTFCYPGKATKAYALASPIMFRSGMSVIYWYTNPSNVPAQDKGLLKIWDNMPTTWEESLFLEGSLYEYATTARRAADGSWYVGSLSAVTRTLELPLDFLDEGVTYVAEIYADGVDADPYAGWVAGSGGAKATQTLDVKNVLVSSETVLQRDLKYGFGYAVVLTPAGEEDLAAYSEYNVYRQELGLEIDRARLVTNDGYTSDSFAVFKAALADAEAVYADASASDEQMEEAMTALEGARLALVTTAELEAAIAGTIYYTSYHYTGDSYGALADAVTAAQALLDGGSFTQAELDSAKTAIEEAEAGLTADPDRVLKKTVYLDELDYDTTNSYAHAGAIKRKTDYYGSTLSLMVNGTETVFERGLMTHAQSEVYYNIEGLDLQIFQAYVGVDTVKASQGNVIFRVYGDGVLLYESAASGNGSQNAQYFSIPIAGVKELRLEANMAGSNDGDHAVWGDAKFLVYRDPEALLDTITVDGEALAGFSRDVLEYTVYAPDAGNIPVVDAVPAEDDITYTVEAAKAIPGVTKIHATRPDGTVVTYRVYLLNTVDSDYISDLPNSLIVKNTLYGLNKDSVQGNKLALTAADGTSAIYYTKGLGTHAKSSTDSMVVYNIEGLGYDRFVGYVGISYLKNDSRSSVNFKLYVDDETTPRFESGKMGYRTPAIYYNVDISGAKTLTLVADACGDQSADHGAWCDAKFLKYTGVQSVSGHVDVANTGLAPAGIPVSLYKEGGDVPELTVLTDENGDYAFANVLVGSYELRIEAGENHLAASADVSVAAQDVVQDITLRAPRYTISVIQSADAIVLTDLPTASLGQTITVYIRDITPGMEVSAVHVTADDGTAVEAALTGNVYTFTMPAQAVTVHAVLAEDPNYEADLAAAAAIDERLMAVGQVTLEKRADIQAIRADYEALSDSAKSYVKKLALLEYYEYLLENLAVQDQAQAAAAAAEAAKAAAEAAQAAAEEAAAASAGDKEAAEAAKAAAEMARAAAEAAQAAAEAAQAAAEANDENAAASAASAAEAAGSAAESAAAAAQANLDAQNAQAAAETAQTAAQEAAASAAVDKASAEAAQAAAETARAAAEEAQTRAETAMADAEDAQAAAEMAAEAAAASNTAAAEEAAKSAASAAESAVSAAESAASAVKSAESASAAAEAAARAQTAQAAAEEAQAKAESAQAAAQEAAASAAEDKTSAQTAAEAAKLAQEKAETAQAAAEAAKAAADEAAAAAESSNVSAAKSAAAAAQSATVSATGAAASASAAASAAESAALAQAAKADAEAAAKEAEADQEAAQEALEEALRAEEEAKKAAADAALSLSKYNALSEIDKLLPELLEEVSSENHIALIEAADAARQDINAAASQEELADTLDKAKAAMTGLAGTRCAAEEFVDVTRNVWFHEAVDFVLNEGMMSGYGDETFAPQDELSRAMLVQILYNIEGRPETETGKSFSDVAEGDWYYDAVMWAAENGIVLGRDDGTYDPTAPVTREQMVTILYRYAGSPEVEDDHIGFIDAADIHDWAQTAVVWAVENEIVRGMGDDRFAPTLGATRAQAAQIMMNYFA